MVLWPFENCSLCCILFVMSLNDMIREDTPVVGEPYLFRYKMGFSLSIRHYKYINLSYVI